jgi:hypothetical protein
MKIFKLWLNDYKNKKAKEPNYKFLELETIIKYEKIAEEYGISEGAKDFLKVYKRVKKPYKLKYIPIKKSRPQGHDYYSFRNYFIKSRLSQMRATKTNLFYTKGKYKGLRF